MRKLLIKSKPFLRKMRLLNASLSLYFLIRRVRTRLTNKIHKSIYKTVPVLLYHRIDNLDNDPVMLSVRPDTFDKHMKYLQENYDPISLNEMIERAKGNCLNGKEVCVTFDDGYRDNMMNALPILQKYNIPATIFITTSQIGQKASFEWDEKYADNERAHFLSEMEIRILSNNPLIDIGAHTHTHRRLSDLPYNEQLNEIKKSKVILEDIIGKPLNNFAYPFGSSTDFDKDSIRIVKELGFISAYENTGLLGYRGSSIYSFPRINIRECDIDDLKKII